MRIRNEPFWSLHLLTLAPAVSQKELEKALHESADTRVEANLQKVKARSQKGIILLRFRCRLLGQLAVYSQARRHKLRCGPWESGARSAVKSRMELFSKDKSFLPPLFRTLTAACRPR